VIALIINISLFLFWVIGPVVIWITPIRRNYKVFKTISALLIATNLYFLYGAFISFSIGWIVIVSAPLLLIVLSLVFRSRKPSFEKPTATTKSASRGKLWAWFFFILVTTASGMAAYFIDLDSPSDMDIYTDTNESATMILIGMLIVNLFLGIGARFSYLKYSRINQADLIANAIKTQVQTPGTNTTSTAAPAKTQDTEDRLRKLESLLTNGLISQDEYGQKKKEIIDSI
jgi:hypothetical protein